jgi:hypothetical protein
MDKLLRMLLTSIMYKYRNNVNNDQKINETIINYKDLLYIIIIIRKKIN